MTSTTVEAQAGSLESGDLLVLLRFKSKGKGLTSRGLRGSWPWSDSRKTAMSGRPEPGMRTGSTRSGDARLKHNAPAPSSDARLRRAPTRRHYHVPGESKLLGSLEEAIRASGLKDGDTISFHYHLREGDAVLNLVMGTIAKMGYQDIRLAASSLNAVNDEIVPLLHNGVITSTTTSGARGELGRAISAGTLATPVIFRSHGGRARAIEEGTIAIDVAFLAGAGL